MFDLKSGGLVPLGPPQKLMGCTASKYQDLKEYGPESARPGAKPRKRIEYEDEFEI